MLRGLVAGSGRALVHTTMLAASRPGWRHISVRVPAGRRPHVSTTQRPRSKDLWPLQLRLPCCNGTSTFLYVYAGWPGREASWLRRRGRIGKGARKTTPLDPPQLRLVDSLASPSSPSSPRQPMTAHDMSRNAPALSNAASQPRCRYTGRRLLARMCRASTYRLSDRTEPSMRIGIVRRRSLGAVRCPYAYRGCCRRCCVAETPMSDPMTLRQVARARLGTWQLL